MKRKVINLAMAVSLGAVSFGMLSGFGLGDAMKGIDTSKSDCGDSKDCNKEIAKDVAKGVAIGLAAKLISEMVIEAYTEQTSNEGKVKSKYLKTHDSLPKEPVVTIYTTAAEPGKVISAGNQLKLNSDMEVVPAKNANSTAVAEQITIYDAENPKQELKSYTKVVNKDTNKAGAFKNQFKFTMPKGLPQGVYPIKTAVLVDEKRLKLENNDVQLVLNVDENGGMRVIALNAREYKLAMNDK